MANGGKPHKVDGCHKEKPMAVRKRNEVWYYDFQIKRIRYLGVISEAQNKQEVKRAEAQIRTAVFDGKYGKPSGEANFMEYAETNFLPWSKDNITPAINVDLRFNSVPAIIRRVDYVEEHFKVTTHEKANTDGHRPDQVT